MSVDVWSEHPDTKPNTAINTTYYGPANSLQFDLLPPYFVTISLLTVRVTALSTELRRSAAMKCVRFCWNSVFNAGGNSEGSVLFLRAPEQTNRISLWAPAANVDILRAAVAYIARRLACSLARDYRAHGHKGWTFVEAFMLSSRSSIIHGFISWPILSSASSTRQAPLRVVWRTLDEPVLRPSFDHKGSMVRSANSAIHCNCSRIASTSARPGRPTGDGLKRAKHPQHDDDIAYGAASNLIKRFGHQARKGRSDGDDPDFPVLIAA